MYDLTTVGKRIVNELTKLIEEQIIVTNQEGIIKASTEENRIGEFHEGSLLAMRAQDIIHINESKSEKLKGVRPGMVFPIIVHKQAIGVIGVTGDPQQISSYGMLVKKLAEMLITDFIHQRDHLQKERFLYDLLHELSDNAFQIQVNEIKLDVNKRYQIMLVDGLSKEDIIMPIEGMIYTTIQQQQFALLVEVEQTALLIHKFPGAKIAIGGQYPLKKMKQSYEEAIYTLAYCSELKPIVYESELLIELLVADISRDNAIKFSTRLFGTLLKDRFLFEHIKLRIMTDLTLTEIAKELHIHRNTLNYRLSKIEEIIGFKLNDPKGRTNLYIGCLLVEKFDLL